MLKEALIYKLFNQFYAKKEEKSCFIKISMLNLMHSFELLDIDE